MTQKDNKKKGKKKNKWLMFIASFLIFLVFSVVGGYFILLTAGEPLIDLEKLEDIKLEASVVYDRHGNKVGQLYINENRDYATFHEIPEMLIKAFIAVEDKRFYEHNGIDPIRLGGAIIKDIRAGGLVEGGSTITQQLAKNVFLSNEKTFWRKTKEAIIAINLDRKFSKDQILEMYLNKIYMGNGVFGVKAAAKYYFNKDLNQLSLAEMANLAAIPKAPSYYAPTADPEQSKLRRNTVLRLMAEQGMITEEEKNAAQSEEIKVAAIKEDNRINKNYRAYLDYVIREAENKYGVTEEMLYRGGWEIHTNLDKAMQDAMVAAFADSKNFPQGGAEREVEAAMVVVDAQTGGIAAMMGGRNYVAKGFNLATNMKRQPGSSFKPVAVFAPALDSGKWNVNSRLSNERQSFNGYEPRNYNNKYSKSVSMREAVRNSDNVPAVWLLNEIGIDTSLAYLKKFGFELESEDRNLAIALGGLSKGTSPLQMAQAYTAFANGGNMAEAHAIVELKNEHGEVVGQAEPTLTQVISAKAAWDMHTMLKEAVDRGTGKLARISGREVAGKTGTTQSEIKTSGAKYNKDAWFVGYTPEYVGAVWMGFDREDPQHVMADGSGKPAQLFSKVFAEGLKNVKAKPFVPPAGAETVTKQPEMTAPVLTAVMTFENGEPKVVISWTGNEDLPLTYSLYRFIHSPDDKQLLIADTTDRAYVDPLKEPILYKYLVIPKDEAGMEGPPSNIAEVDISQISDFIENSDYHHRNEDGTDWTWPEDGGEGYEQNPWLPGEDAEFGDQSDDQAEDNRENWERSDQEETPPEPNGTWEQPADIPSFEGGGVQAPFSSPNHVPPAYLQ